MAPLSPRKRLLQAQSYSFCQFVLDGYPPSDTVSSFFIPDPPSTNPVPATHRPRITEHGPWWSNSHLPFLADTFVGTTACVDYFTRLGETLQFIVHEHTFPPMEGFVVDEDAVVYDSQGRPVYDEESNARKGVVNVQGWAKFKSKKTGKEWDESFVYRLSGFDDAGRFGHWEIWADTLSAWEAVVGGVFTA